MIFRLMTPAVIGALLCAFGVPCALADVDFATTTTATSATTAVAGRPFITAVTTTTTTTTTAATPPVRTVPIRTLPATTTTAATHRPARTVPVRTVRTNATEVVAQTTVGGASSFPDKTAGAGAAASSATIQADVTLEFQVLTKNQLVAELIDYEAGAVEVDNIRASGHISDCAARFTGGHVLGKLLEKDPDTNQPIVDEYGNYIETDTYIIPDQGIMLSSGRPQDFHWNDADDQTTDWNADGDSDLKASVDASNGWNNAVLDACVLEFDFRCTNEAFIPQVQFNYIWGSEEYYEYVDSPFNDVFGFYLNGQNIARLPTTTTDSDIVSINNVNYNANKEYFHGNDPGTGWAEQDPDAPPTFVFYPTVEADGFTDTMEARGTPYQDAEEWNTIKLAVGDVGDRILDSWVVLEGASFTCVDVTDAPSISLSPSDAPSFKPSTSTSPSIAPSSAPTLSSAPSSAPSLGPTMSIAPTIHPTDTPSGSTSPSRGPSLAPSESSVPTLAPSEAPTLSTMPSLVPSEEPTLSTMPSLVPSDEPTLSTKPSLIPSEAPTLSTKPSLVPSDEPTLSTEPSLVPSEAPTLSAKPTLVPSEAPTLSTEPSEGPSMAPSMSSKPTSVPSSTPTLSAWPSMHPSDSPSGSVWPTLVPSMNPSVSQWPTQAPTSVPSVSSAPAESPSVAPSESSSPSQVPTLQPSASVAPSDRPSAEPSVSGRPSFSPSDVPSISSKPSESPSDSPSESSAPSGSPSVHPSSSSGPTLAPSDAPSTSSKPTLVPSEEPTLSTEPSESPSEAPTLSTKPSASPSEAPSVSGQPSGSPSLSPSTSTEPSLVPSEAPTLSAKPTLVPSEAPTLSTEPSEGPSMAPSMSSKPTSVPSATPTLSTRPSMPPTDVPSVSSAPAGAPSAAPSKSSSPSLAGSMHPSVSSEPSTSPPTEMPTLRPSISAAPSDRPSMKPSISGKPSVSPSAVPTTTSMPTASPSDSPSDSIAPSITGSLTPSVSTSPSSAPTLRPSTSLAPSDSPSMSPTKSGKPSFSPTGAPSVSSEPTGFPSDAPSITSEPSVSPSQSPSESSAPSITGSLRPSVSGAPSSQPSVGPSVSVEPTLAPSDEPTLSTEPSAHPTYAPSTSTAPTLAPSEAPTLSTKPTLAPSDVPTISGAPAGSPSAEPTESSHPSFAGSAPPSVSQEPSTSPPTEVPTLRPSTSTSPSEGPTEKPSISGFPSISPSDSPTVSSRPSKGPSNSPSTSNVPSITLSQSPSVSTSPSYAPSTLGSIGPNVVFNDLDEDGVQDPDEPNLPGVTVELFCMNGDGINELIETVVTSEDGAYEFTQVEPAPCFVAVDDVINGTTYVFSPVTEDGNQIYPNGTSPVVQVNYNENVDDWDVGVYLPLSEIGPNVVFNDLDGDGVQEEDEGEGPLQGVSVTLICDGGQVATTATDGDGVYQFSDVHPGDCHVVVIPEVNDNDNYVFSPVVDGGNQIHPNGTSPIVAIGYNETVDDWDVGMYLPLSQVGPSTVFDDLDQDGVQDVGEEPLENVAVALKCDGQIVGVDITGANGEYEFNGVEPGECHVEVSPLADMVFSPVVPDGNQISPVGTSPIVSIGYNETVDAWDVGMYLPPATIGPNVVFNDLDEDGVQDPEEELLEGVIVELYCYVDGEPILQGTNTTNADGEYYFEAVNPGACFIAVVPEVNNNTNYVFSPITEGGNQIYHNGTSPVVVVDWNDNVDDWDVGMYLPLSEVGPNVVFNDLDGDGVQDGGEGEDPLEGVTVTLVCDGSVVESTTTNSDGVYQFIDVQPGDCYVTVAPEVDGNDNYVFSPVVDDGNQIYPDGTSPIVSIGYNETIDDWDVGMYLPLANVGPNTVFNDLDQDGIHDEDEPPLVAVPITLVCDGVEQGITTSDSTGQYEFNGVQPGDCHIEVTNPDPDYTFSPVVADGNQIYPDGTSPTVTVGYNETVDAWDVGMYQPPATIGPNVVFDDLDGDGQRDPLEPILENVTVELYCYIDGVPVLQGTNTTDSDGEYYFNSVNPGACYIAVDPVDDYIFSPIVPDGNQIQPNGTSPVTDVDWNDNINDWDVGMYLGATLGNKVWDDLNGNGIQEEGEPGIGGVLVTLVDGNGNELDTTTFTDSDGRYWFTGLAPGQYGVQFSLPPDYVFADAPEDLSSDLLLGPNPNPLDIAMDMVAVSESVGATPSQTLTSGENNTSFDAGIYIPVFVGGVVWDDLNADGIQDDGEPILAGAGIAVFDGDSGYIDWVETGADGTYALNLEPGTYYGTISPPSNDHLLSPQVEGGSDYDPDTMQTAPLTLQSGGSGEGSFDAGFYIPGTISSFVWNDLDADGIHDEDEGPYTGDMNVILYSASDPNGNPVAFTSTDPSDGSYTLPDVPPGDYVIEFVPGEVGVSFSPQNVGGDDSMDSDVDPSTGRAPLTVTSGQVLTDISAGLTAMPSIGPNTVFQDDNGNGIQDEGELGLNEVTVILFNSEGEEVDVVVTSGFGNYQFGNLEPGDYSISVINDPNFLFSPVIVGGNQVGPDSNNEYGNSSPTVTLGMGDNDRTLLVGMYEPVTVGNVVWNDLNGNGILDENEPGMESITATLRDVDGVLLDTTTTNATGYYYFRDLRPGSYSVQFSKPEEFIFTVKAKNTTEITRPSHPDGSTHYDDVTSDVDRTTGATDVKYLTSGEENYSFDAGMFIPVIITGTTWHDLNANGIEDDGEPPLRDVTATLYDRDGDYVDNRVTGDDGLWIFDEMPPGTYTVEIMPPDDEMELSPRPVGNGTLTTDFNPEDWMTDNIILQGGETSEGLTDAGLYLPATIGDRIWFEDVPNGIQDSDEESFTEIVTIKLYDELGYLVKETESTETGFYQITDVRPGTYDIEFILPGENEYQFTVPNAGNNTDVDSDVSPTTGRVSVTLTSGEEKGDIDAGVMDYGPYYPDWTNDVQVCTNDGFDAAWLEIQKDNYLYRNKEECCKTHFWWRMTQCMANEEFKFYQNGEICDTKIFFEDWEDNSPSEWTKTTQFDTLEECCANEFWFDYKGCVERSPVIFKFEFCVEVQGLVDPPDCQSADIYANVLEDAVNEGCHHDHGLSDVGPHRALKGGDDTTADAKIRALGEGDHMSVDAMVNKIGGVSLSKVDGSTVCGGSLGGQGFTNELTGTVPDIESAVNTAVTVCGVITVEEDECTGEECLREHYHLLEHELEEFVNLGDLTLAIQRRSISRLPPVPELHVVTAIPYTLTAQNLLLPATITGELNLQFFHGNDLHTCMEKSVFQPNETPYVNLVECCETHFQWDVDGCCAKGGGCPELGIGGIAEVVNADGDVVEFFPTWKQGKLCDSKTKFEDWETTKHLTLRECCSEHFSGDDYGRCMNPTG